MIYELTEWKWLSIPWLPVSLIGTAVAFYVGFKNNQAYDRLWEARKIWGAIVNSSRSWGVMVGSYINHQFTNTPISASDLASIQRRMVYRHIAWLYQLRDQLLVPTEWEHINQNRLVRRLTESRRERLGVGTLGDHHLDSKLAEFLSSEELDGLKGYKNVATHLINSQAKELAQLREQGLIDDFRHMELQKELNAFYTHQGKCERIKKFPLPRQYGSMSFTFVAIFIFLLPFGMVPEFQKLGDFGIWLSIPLTVLVSWVYITMELVGDYSENPFEGMGNDIPMLSLTRTIEIDLRQMLGETELPPPIEAKNGILM